MKLTKDEQIELLNESIWKLMQENSELKTQVETDDNLRNFELEHSYRQGWDDGYSEGAEDNFYE